MARFISFCAITFLFVCAFTSRAQALVSITSKSPYLTKDSKSVELTCHLGNQKIHANDSISFYVNQAEVYSSSSANMKPIYGSGVSVNVKTRQTIVYQTSNSPINAECKINRDTSAQIIVPFVSLDLSLNPPVQNVRTATCHWSSNPSETLKVTSTRLLFDNEVIAEYSATGNFINRNHTFDTFIEVSPASMNSFNLKLDRKAPKGNLSCSVIAKLGKQTHDIKSKSTEIGSYQPSFVERWMNKMKLNPYDFIFYLILYMALFIFILLLIIFGLVVGIFCCNKSRESACANDANSLCKVSAESSTLDDHSNV